MTNRCEDCIFAVGFNKPFPKSATKRTGTSWGGQVTANLKEALNQDLYDTQLENYTLRISCHRYPVCVTKSKEDFCGEFRITAV